MTSVRTRVTKICIAIQIPVAGVNAYLAARVEPRPWTLIVTVMCLLVAGFVWCKGERHEVPA